jgi:hypothetical protein
VSIELFNNAKELENLQSNWQTGLAPTAKQIEKNRIQSTIMDVTQMILAGGQIAGGVINVVNNGKNVKAAEGWANEARKCKEQTLRLQMWYKGYGQDAGD